VTTTSTDIDNLFTDLPVEFSGTLDRTNAYSALLDFLDHIRSLGQDLITVPELWTCLRSLPASEKFGPRARLLTLLGTAKHDHAIHRTAAGAILLRPDAPSSGGPEHVWIRLEGRGGAEVEITGADPWPDAQLHAPGPAWWRCTGCRANSGMRAENFGVVRAAATEHASRCHAQPAPQASQ
jgi:hypothetical protein